MISVETQHLIDHGQGLFETLKIQEGKILNLEAHYERLSKSLMFFNMPPIELEAFELEIMKAYHNDHKPVVRLTCLKNKNENKIILNSRDNPYSFEMYEKGFCLKKSMVVKKAENILLQHKTTRIEESILEKQELLKEGFQESVHFNEKGFITEGVYCNLFFVKNKKLYTPHINAGVLPGILRKNVLKTIKKLGLFCEIGYYKEEALCFADEVFMTNAVMGIMPVSKYEQSTYDLSKNDMTRSLMEAYNNGLL